MNIRAQTHIIGVLFFFGQKSATVMLHDGCCEKVYSFKKKVQFKVYLSEMDNILQVLTQFVTIKST
jgi:hypothetical protein